MACIQSISLGTQRREWQVCGKPDSFSVQIAANTVPVCHYMIQHLVELYGGCMVVLKVS
jgi:hypothetical protein